ncbi:tubulin binding cofactor C-domain-containing protein [Syncephalis fuscata]|nr:tubulin binding cofactor C-domain-containing protein [Syncephalis fuscata]
MTQPLDNTSSTTKAGASTHFWTEFQKEQEFIQAALDSIQSSGRGLDDQLSRLLQQINALRSKVTEALVYIPTYDEQQYMKALNTLSEQLSQKRTRFAPRKKFAFRSRPVASSTEPTPNVASTLSGTSNNDISTATAATVSSNSMTTSNNASEQNIGSAFEIRDQSGQYTALADQLAGDVSKATLATNDCALTNMTNCIIDLRLPATDTSTGSNAYRPLSALHIRKLKRCIVLVGNVEGSIMLHECQQCIFLMACRQFRMHTSDQCDIYMHCSSQPIIEHCNRIRFAPPSSVFTEQQLRNTAFATEANRWQEVNDFLWIKRHQASPNWSLLADDAVERTDTQQALLWQTATTQFDNDSSSELEQRLTTFVPS